MSAYSDDYATSTSKKTFTITGEKPPAPEVSVDKSEVLASECYTFTIDTKDADALVYKTNGYADSHAIDIMGDKTHWYDVNDWSNGFITYQFAVLRDDKWSAWSIPIAINIRAKPILEEPVIYADESP